MGEKGKVNGVVARDTHVTCTHTLLVLYFQSSWAWWCWTGRNETNACTYFQPSSTPFVESLRHRWCHVRLSIASKLGPRSSLVRRRALHNMTARFPARKKHGVSGGLEAGISHLLAVYRSQCLMVQRGHLIQHACIQSLARFYLYWYSHSFLEMEREKSRVKREA